MVIDRREAVTELLETRDEALVITGLGSPSYDVHAAGDSPANFYLWGAMGGAALVGLGVALGNPRRRVLVITGDGEQLMALGALATISIAKPTNLDIVVLDNEHFGETGMQQSHTGAGLDLSAIAASCGFAASGVVSTIDEVRELGETLRTRPDGPRLFVCKVKADSPARSLPYRDAVHLKNRFRSNLGLEPS